MIASSSSRLQLLRLRSESLEVSILPEVGAKLFDLIDRTNGHNFLWHNPRIAPQIYPIEANFDNYWCGGWDDGFPTCETCAHNGEVYPNLGELRSLRWEVDALDVTTLEPSVCLTSFGPISPIKARKIVRVCNGSLETEFSVHHIGHHPIDFIWGTHPAYVIESDCVLHIPARTGIVGQANHLRLGEPGQRYEWPLLKTRDDSVDMSRIGSPGQLWAGHYATDLSAGWYALEYPGRQTGLLFEFPPDVCPYLWMWLSYGGWRGHYVAVVEPWTSCPVTLSEAVTAQTHRTLLPGDVFSCVVRATPWRPPMTLWRLLEKRNLALVE